MARTLTSSSFPPLPSSSSLQEPQEQEQKQQQQQKPQTKEEEKRHGAGDEYERTTRITGIGSAIDSNPNIKEQEKEQQHHKEEQEKQQQENKQEQESSQSSPIEMMEDEPNSTMNNQHTSRPNTATSDQEEQDDKNRCYKEPHPSFQRPTSSNPPGNCPDGGQWGIVKYIGNKTGVLICLGCFLGGIFGLCMLACPQDEKDAYRVNGELYDAAGAYMGLTKKYKFIPTRT